MEGCSPVSKNWRGQRPALSPRQLRRLLCCFLRASLDRESHQANAKHCVYTAHACAGASKPRLALTIASPLSARYSSFYADNRSRLEKIARCRTRVNVFRSSYVSPEALVTWRKSWASEAATLSCPAIVFYNSRCCILINQRCGV